MAAYVSPPDRFLRIVLPRSTGPDGRYCFGLYMYIAYIGGFREGAGSHPPLVKNKEKLVENCVIFP